MQEQEVHACLDILYGAFGFSPGTGAVRNVKNTRSSKSVSCMVQFYLIAWDGARAHTTQCCSFMYFLCAV